MQQGHCALRTSCVRELELRRSWQPNRNFVFNLRPSRRDEGHVLSKYSGKPKRSFSTQSLMLRRVVILLKPSTSSETRRDATNSLTNFFAAGFFRRTILMALLLCHSSPNQLTQERHPSNAPRGPPPLYRRICCRSRSGPRGPLATY